MDVEKTIDLKYFEKLEKIGEGGYGKVFKVRNLETGYTFAAKIYIKSFDDQEGLDLKREVNNMAKLQHPSVLKFIGYSSTDFKNRPNPVIVTEYMQNGSLSHVLNSQAQFEFDNTKKLICIYGIASGMSYLHANKLIHRDLKPQNILMDNDLQPKIADFGLSKIIHHNESSMTTQSTGATKGTTIYMAPEIWTAYLYDKPCDVFAFGMIVYQIITQKVPFEKIQFSYIIPSKITNGERPEIPDSVSPCYRELIKKCWLQNPNERPTFSQITEQLKTDKRFLTKDIDKEEFKKYISSFDNSIIIFDRNRKIITTQNTFIKYKDNVFIFNICKRKELHGQLLNFIDSQENIDNDFQIFSNYLKDQKIPQNRSDLYYILKSISFIGRYHNRQKDFFDKIYRIIDYFTNDIKTIFSKEEIFELFKYNYQILIYLFQKGILIADKNFYDQISGMSDIIGRSFYIILYPVLKSVFSKNEKKRYLRKILKWTELKNEKIDKEEISKMIEDKLILGENDHHICSLIRQDNVDEFISYVNQTNLPLSSEIEHSIFETNLLLLENKKTTLIEYAAFFGSIKIFQYLRMNNAEMNPSLWYYAIHSGNAELIHCLEDNKIKPPDGTFQNCLKESIKCHQNNIAHYIEDYILKRPYKNKIIDSQEFYNWEFFPEEIYLLFSLPKSDIGLDICTDVTDITIPPSVATIGRYTFKGFSNLKKISIPSSVQKIDLLAFEGCTSLTNIVIDSFNFEATYQIFNGQKSVQFANKKGTIPDIFFISSTIEQINCSDNILKIGNSAFRKCSRLTQITLPSYLEVIGMKAFDHCSILTQITIPSSVTCIGDYAFSNCRKLVTISLPNSITQIGAGAFNNCSSLNEITIPPLITQINKVVFNGCSSFTQFVIPPTITKIGDNAFQDCIKLSQINIPSSVTEIGKCAFYHCYSLSQVTIPSSVTYIGDYAFYKCFKLAQLEFLPTLQNISNYLFYGCTLITQITIPSTVSTIGIASFRKCRSLRQVEFIGTNLININESAFRGCVSLSKIDLPNNLNAINNGAFSNCKSLKQISIPISVSEIASKVFNHCISLNSITLPSNFKKIGSEAFKNCFSLTQLKLSSDLESIGEYAFYNCKLLTQINISQNVKEIKERSFEGCSSLTRITIPNSVKIIGAKAFYRCSSIKQIAIPYLVDFIPSWTFGLCSSLTQISILSNIIKISSNVFNGCTSLTQVSISAKTVSLKKRAFSSCKSLTQVSILSDIVTIGKQVFENCSSLSQILIPLRIALIGPKAFYGCSSLLEIPIYSKCKLIEPCTFRKCSSLTQFVIPQSVIQINDKAFDDCTSLTEVSMNSKIKIIGNYAFRNCSSLTQITIPSSVSEIRRCAFQNCTSLTRIDIDSNSIKIGELAFNSSSINTIMISSSQVDVKMGAFSDCSKLEYISIDMLTEIQKNLFNGCTSLTRFSIPSHVEAIGIEAFKNCSSLEEVTIPSSVTKIRKSAFQGCSSLTQIIIPSSVTRIQSSVFSECPSLQKITIPSSLNTKYLGIDSNVEIKSIET